MENKLFKKYTKKVCICIYIHRYGVRCPEIACLFRSVAYNSVAFDLPLRARHQAQTALDRVRSDALPQLASAGSMAMEPHVKCIRLALLRRKQKPGQQDLPVGTLVWDSPCLPFKHHRTRQKPSEQI